MKFIPAFLFLGLFSALAYMVWTGEFPYHLIPVDEYNDPGRVARVEAWVNGMIGHFGAFKTGMGLMIAGLVISVYFVMDPKSKDYEM